MPSKKASKQKSKSKKGKQGNPKSHSKQGKDTNKTDIESSSSNDWQNEAMIQNEELEDISNSEESSSEDDLIRFASTKLKQKCGISQTKNIELEKRTETEIQTHTLTQAHRKVQKIQSKKKKIDSRHEATLQAIQAKASSLTVTPTPTTKSNSISKLNSPSLQSSKSKSKEIKNRSHIEKLFESAPIEVLDLFLQGQKYLHGKNFDKALENFLQARDIVQEKECKKKELWWDHLLGNIGVAYQQQGLIQNALTCYKEIIGCLDFEHLKSCSDVNKKHLMLELKADVLRYMSIAYREIGEIGLAKAYSDESKALFYQLIPEHLRTEKPLITIELANFLQESMCGNHKNLWNILHHQHEKISIKNAVEFCDSITGATFLMAASGQGNMKLVHELVEINKAPLEIKDARGLTALAWACRFGHVEVINNLLQLGARFSYLNLDELSTWPLTSLNALHDYMKRMKVTETIPPPPPLTSPQMEKPINSNKKKSKKKNRNKIKVESKEATETIHNIPKNFDAAPKSKDAKDGKLVGRELQRWNDSTCAEESLDSDNSKQELSHWDQFEANKQIFGIESTYSEELYTTKLEKSMFTEEQRLQAEKLAKEIQAEQSHGNIHVAEERGQDLSRMMKEMDEEARYGAVLGSGAYRPTNQVDEKEVEDDPFIDSKILDLT